MWLLKISRLLPGNAKRRISRESFDHIHQIVIKIYAEDFWISQLGFYSAALKQLQRYIESFGTI